MIKFNQAWLEKEGAKNVLRQSKGNRRKILALVCKACVGEEHAEVRRHPRRGARQGHVAEDQIFRTAPARAGLCPDRRKGRAERGRVRAALLQRRGRALCRHGRRAACVRAWAATDVV